MSKSIYHNHHIIPRHAGGTDSPDNLVRLTVEEHAEAHRKLYEEYGRWQDKKAWQGLAGFRGKEEIIKEIRSRPKSEETKKKIRETLTGRKLTEEHKKNIRESCNWTEAGRKWGKMNKGRKHTEEHKQKNREAQTGRICSEETKKKMSESLKAKYVETLKGNL